MEREDHCGGQSSFSAWRSFSHIVDDTKTPDSRFLPKPFYQGKSVCQVLRPLGSLPNQTLIVLTPWDSRLPATQDAAARNGSGQSGCSILGSH